MRKKILSVITGLAVLAGIVLVAGQASAAPLTKVLVFSKTAGFRHGSSIAAGISTIQALGAANGFSVTATEDAGAFTVANLAQYQAVIWLSTTGDVLNTDQQNAFQSYIGSGGGFVGVHSATDTESDWPWYGGLVGTYFSSHPSIQQATIRVEDHANPSTSHLSATWIRTDEWYNFRTNPRANVHVLMTLDESTYSGGSMGADHPITWCQNYGGGRSWYTGLGHTDETYSEPDFRQMLLGGIRVAAGSVAANCGASSQPSPSPSVPPLPSTVSLRAYANNKYVVAENNGNDPLIANRGAVGPWEKFDLIDLGNDKIALRAQANGRYVCAENQGNAPLIANRDAIGSWERFTLIHNADGTVSLRAEANGMLVVAEDGGSKPLIANRSAIGQWEKFYLATA